MRDEPSEWLSPGESLPEILVRGLQPASQNPYPIYDQTRRFSLPYIYDLTKIRYLMYIFPVPKSITLFQNIICTNLWRLFVDGLIELYFQWLVKFTVFHTSKRKMYKRFSWRLVFRKNILPSRKKSNQIYGKKITWWLYHEVHFCTSATLRLSAFALKFSKQFGNFSSGLARIRTVFDYFFHSSNDVPSKH